MKQTMQNTEQGVSHVESNKCWLLVLLLFSMIITTKLLFTMIITTNMRDSFSVDAVMPRENRTLKYILRKKSSFPYSNIHSFCKEN